MSLGMFAMRGLPGLELDGDAHPGRTLANALAAASRSIVERREALATDHRLTPAGRAELEREHVLATARKLAPAIASARAAAARHAADIAQARRTATAQLYDAALPPADRADVRDAMLAMPREELAAFLRRKLTLEVDRNGVQGGSHDLAAVLATAPRLLRELILDRAGYDHRAAERVLERFSAPVPAELGPLQEELAYTERALHYARDVADELVRGATDARDHDGARAIGEAFGAVGQPDAPPDRVLELANGRPDPAAAPQGRHDLGALRELADDGDPEAA